MPSPKHAQAKEGPQLIPLNRLKKSPRNARTVPHTKDEIEALAASIAVHGLLQDPVVEPERDGKHKLTGYFLVTIGEGRRQALLLRAKRKEIKRNHVVRCVIDTEHDAHEISLAENTVRSPMHPAEQFTAFYELHTAKGMSAEDIAARFGVTPAVVRQRLKLATVSPRLIKAYRKGEMTLDQLTAFTVCDDVALQERVWREIGSFSRREDILAALTQQQISQSDPRAIFVGMGEYQAAGGAIVQDLFAEQDGGYLADAELLFRLATEKLDRLAADIRSEGWKWVEVMPRLDHAAISNCRRIYPATRALSLEDDAKLAALEAEYEALEYDDEASAKEIARLEEAIAELQGEPVYDPEAIARAGAIVTISHNGKLRVERGLVRPEDEVRPAKAPGDKERDGPAPLSDKLLTELTAYRTAALQEALGSNTDVALTAITHRLALLASFHGAAESSCLQVTTTTPHLLGYAPAIEAYPPAQRIQARRERLRGALPQDPAELWDYVAGLAPDARVALLAHCLALTLDAIERPVPSEARKLHADQLTQALGLDMAAEWAPTAANYFGRVIKERILEAVSEGASGEAARQIAGLTKGAMAEAAEKLLAGRGWLPEPMRVPATHDQPSNVNRLRVSRRHGSEPAP